MRKVIFVPASVILLKGDVGAGPWYLGGCLIWGFPGPRGASAPVGGCLVETPWDSHFCGQYASYCNAFLFIIFVVEIRGCKWNKTYCKTFLANQFQVISNDASRWSCSIFWMACKFLHSPITIMEPLTTPSLYTIFCSRWEGLWLRFLGCLPHSPSGNTLSLPKTLQGPEAYTPPLGHTPPCA